MTKTKLIGGGAILIVLFTLSYTKADTVVYKASEPSLPHPEATAVAAATTYTATDISELKSILTNLTALVGHLIDQQAHQSLTYTSNTRSSRDAADTDFTVKQADRIYETIGDNLDETNDSLSSLTDRVDTLRDDLASLTLSVSSSTPKYYAESTSTPSTAPQVTGSRSVAIGDGSYVSGSGSIALGDHVSVTGSLSVAVGTYAAATTLNTFAFGYGAFASGVFSQAIGSLNNVSGYAASAFGFQNTVSGAGASAFGSSLTNSIGTSTMIGPSNAAKLTILGAAGSVGFVGIGTTTPSAKLHVTGTAGNSDIFALSSSTNTRLLTVTSAGKVGIGTTTPTQKLSVVGNAQFTGVTSGAYAADLNLTADGTLTTASSDRRLKDNETLLDTKDTLTKLLTLAPKSFTWKETGTTDIGFIAQDVEPIFPELVFTNPNDGYMGINYSRLPALIVAAIQEMWMMLTRHEEDIELLKTENDTLKEENGELKNRLRVIENELDITHNTDTEGPEEGDEEMSDGEPPVPEAPAEEGKPTPETLDEDSTHAEDETPAEETENPAPAPES